MGIENVEELKPDPEDDNEETTEYRGDDFSISPDEFLFGAEDEY